MGRVAPIILCAPMRAPFLDFDGDEEEPFKNNEGHCAKPMFDANHVTSAALHHFRLCNVFPMF
jgi:hypothetical protein